MMIQFGVSEWLTYPPNGVRISSGDLMCDNPRQVSFGMGLVVIIPWPCIGECDMVRVSGRGL